jgi:hypothetical protein
MVQKFAPKKKKEVKKRIFFHRLLQNLAKFDHTPPPKKRGGFCQIYTGS